MWTKGSIKLSKNSWKSTYGYFEYFEIRKTCSSSYNSELNDSDEQIDTDSAPAVYSQAESNEFQKKKG